MKMFVYSMRMYDEYPCFEKYCTQYGIEYDYTTQTPCLDNLDLCRGCEIVNILTTLFDRPMLEKLKEMGVKCLATRTIGYDHVDIACAKELGIGVIHISYSPNTVADFTLMMMLMGLRKVKYTLQRADVQDYSLEGKLGRELRSCTVGVVGTGRIGRTVIGYLTGFGCRILGYDVCESEEVKQAATYVDLDTLLAESDIITLHAPATEETCHMIDAAAIEKMKTGVIFINCARGSLVDTDALIDGIESGKIGYAGLDVVENEHGLYYFNRMGEPLHNPKLAVLRSYSNVLVTPHTAFYTDQAVSDMAENSILGALQYMRGEDTPFLAC